MLKIETEKSPSQDQDRGAVYPGKDTEKSQAQDQDRRLNIQV